ncbi:MAG TPA: GTP-binding protein [Candidatus Deferrimicrobiaceae bacterium]|nr:GTP-binding protein [Candidatus Deferrimicrobiaceae bacterium]
MEAAEARTPIGLIAGSLGSGKTTLLRKVLGRADRRYAVLVNEFGELPIDSEVIRGTNVEITELVGGCVCCSLTGELEAAVEEILERAHPEYILLEATGIAEADALVYEVEEKIPRVRLDSVVCIVDADASIRFPSVGYAGRSQLRAADIVLINKIDLVTEADIEKVVAQIREFNPDVAVLKTVRCAADVRVLFGLAIENRIQSAPVYGEGTFGSFAYTTAAQLDEWRFREAVSHWPPSVFRAKGFVRFHERGCLFNYVAGRAEFEEFPAEGTELIFIGSKVEKDREAIEELLRRCEA